MDFQEKRSFGDTDLSVSRLGLAGGYGISASSVEKEYHEYGINCFYWNTLRRAGIREAFRNLVKSNREQVTIVLQSYDHVGLTLRRSIQKGLKILNTDYADVVLLGLNNWYPSQGIINQALKLKECGLIRYIALSGHNRKPFGRIAQDSDSPFDIIIVRYNAIHRGAEQDIFPHLSKDNRPGITTYTATRWSHLFKPGKMPPREEPPSAFDCYRFALTNPSVDLCMMGPANEREMLEGITAIEQGPLPAQEMERTKRIGEHNHG